MEVTNKYVTVKTHIDGSAPQESDFELKTTALHLSVEPGSKDVIVKNLYVSIDPYQINRMKIVCSSQKLVSTADGITPGQYKGKEDKLLFFYDVEEFGYHFIEYTIVKGGNTLRKLDPMGFPLSYHLGVLGLSGLTAYAGFVEVCKPKKGEKVFVSAACGSVGNLVGQYAKLFGCHVVELLKGKLGFDDAFNYKEETDLKSTLKRYFPDGMDIYFDNVGGKMLEASVANMNPFGRIAVCGIISEYTGIGERAAPDMIDIVYKRLKIQGFLVIDYLKGMDDFISTMSNHLSTGKIHVLEDISQGVESISSAFVGLFQGDNVGKKVVKVADE
ncbi:2-alkenal reductase (NADP(+)-dependent) [Vitis vinifera]|uniref:2-alkenal reductase (NADP(+)-dependent) n=1 Tax=Vitis vinifera TaxID=29760 RepID=A0A438CZ83_VITVI|nr:2-alkenal reductase (NADP(+)-dependent) [Vitis vinifera]